MSDIDLITRLTLQIFKLNGLLLDEGTRMLEGTGITNSRWRVLGTLTRAGGPQTVPQIAREMGQTRQGIQRLVDVMVQDGLLEYRDNPAHLKSRNVCLTSTGDRLYASLTDRRQSSLSGLAEGLPAARIRAASVLLDALIRNLEARAGGAQTGAIETRSRGG